MKTVSEGGNNMSRENYDEIKSKFEEFIKIWKTKEIDKLDDIVEADTKCFMSTVKAYNTGDQHSLYGVKDFVKDMEPADVFHSRICNYACRFNNDKAQQIATVVFRVAKFEGEKDIKTFEFSVLFANTWKHTEEGWKIAVIRMDVVDASGDYKEFMDKWYFEDSHAKWYEGVHLPVINGELDSPWVMFPKCENVLTEEEAILECFAHYAFGIDTLSFENLRPTFTEDFVAVMAPWGNMDKRGFLTTLKYHRQPSRYWTHSVLPEEITINGNEAKVKAYRMEGHKQRNHPLVITRDNVDTEFACARYEINLRKENGMWKVSRIEYYLGILEVGAYTD